MEILLHYLPSVGEIPGHRRIPILWSSNKVCGGFFLFVCLIAEKKLPGKQSGSLLYGTTFM